MHSRRCTSRKPPFWLVVALVAALFGSSGLPLGAAPTPPVPTVAPAPDFTGRAALRPLRCN